MRKYRENYKELAKKFGLPLEVVEKVADSQFDFLRSVIIAGNDEQVRFQYLGTFRVKPGRRAMVKKKADMLREYANRSKKQREGL
jgi:hypothetical protein